MAQRATSIRVQLVGAFITLHLSCVTVQSAYANDFDDAPDVKALTKGMPKDIALFIARTAECLHWAGEEPYDKEGADYIRNAVEKAGCGDLDTQEKQLHEKYEGQLKVLDAIEKARHLAI